MTVRLVRKSLSIEPELYEDLANEAASRDISFSQLVRKWLRAMAIDEGVKLRKRRKTP